MTSTAEDVATNLALRLIDGAITEVNYLCCFKTHVGNFEQKRDQLAAKKSTVLKDIEDAKKRNETQVEDDVQLWLDETDRVIAEDTKTNMKCFHGWYPNCISQYKQGKKLAKKMAKITDLIERCNNFDKVARLAQLPGIKYYSPQNFMDFDGRKSKFKKLVDILQDGSYYMIGMQGLGGTGKTTLATKVGEQVEESKAFQKVIFEVVSNPPDISKIRRNIASQLKLELEQEKEEEHSKFLWTGIADYKGKVLIILDDIWKELDLRDIGIPYGPNHKNCCVLITTRDLNVCDAMGCQQTITLETLGEDDAFNLFIQQVGKRSDDSSNEFKDLARGITKECGGTPLAIVAVATTIKGWSLQDWKSALKALQNSEPLCNVHNKLEEKVYRSLKLSYDNLDEKAKYPLLLCSLFPEDYEIPIDLLSKLGIGLDLFGEADNYSEARRKVVPIKNDLIKSSLLLEAEENCVKMHDLVREVALWIANQNVQVIMDSRTKVKSNLQFLFWSNDDFPNCFEGTELEILIIWINGEAKVRDTTIFEGMANLKVLFLEGPTFLPIEERKSFTPSLQSLLSLKNIRTLIFFGWELGDISILKNLKCLETFELKYCSITELPKEISELKKLKLLGLRKCNIERNNPFEVIERCSQLEELYFVKNYSEDWEPAENINEVAQDICPPMLQRYSIACSSFKYFDDKGLLKCFNTTHARELISKFMFKDLIRRVEVLEFLETREAKWKTFVDGGMMSDLIKLYLGDSADMGCLIDTDMPPSSFRQLQILKLRNCMKLQRLCFDGNLKLPNLKSLHLENCPMLQPSVFQPSVALCVEQLEKIIVEDCKELRSLITYESLKEEEIVVVDQRKSYGSPFQKLKCLQIQSCDKLELVSPLFSTGDLSLLEDLSISWCEKIKYIFGEYRDEGQALHQDTILPSLTKVELYEVSSFIDIFRECKVCTQRPCPILKYDSKGKHTMFFPKAYGCCFLPTTKDIDIGVSNSLQNLEATKESCAPSKMIETFHIIECLMRQSLSLQNIREMTLKGCSKLKSLFNISIATTIMLEHLKISFCEELKHIITNDTEDGEYVNYTAVFPKLQELQVIACNKLEFIFPTTLSKGLQNLQHIDIRIAQRLKYVFGAYNNDQNINVVPINLLALKKLSLEDVPEMTNLCANKYYLVWPSLQHITLGHCWEKSRRTHYFNLFLHRGKVELENRKELIIRSPFPDFMFCSQPRQLNMETFKEVIMGMQNLISLKVRDSRTIEEIFNLEGIERERPVTLSLQEMELSYLDELRHIYKDPNNILSLCNLKDLRIYECNKLRALFTTSTMKSLPRLSYLVVKKCKELVHIIEEDDYETSANGRSHQLCFPLLENIHICKCHGLRSLFWISTTSTTLPNLKTLEIGAASKLEEVFKRQQDDTQEVLKENVFPNLSTLKLEGLPELRTICQGIEFHSVPNFEVFDCLKYRGPESINSKNKLSTEELEATDFDTDQTMSDMGEAKGEQEIETQELATSDSPTLTESVMESSPEDSAVMETTIVTTLIHSQARGSQSGTSELQLIEGQPRTKQNLADQLNSREATSGIKVPLQTNIAVTKEGVEQSFQEHHGSKEAITPTNSNKGFHHSSETRKEAAGMLLTSELSMATTSSNLESIGNIQEDTTTMKAKTDVSFIYSQAKSSQFGLSPMIDKATEEVGKTVLALPATSTSLDLEIAKEARDANVQHGPKSEKAEMANLLTYSYDFKPNIPLGENTSLPNVNPSSHHQSQTGAASSSSPILEIGEIFQLVELKDGERALLAKALELYPQLRLSSGQRAHPIIAFSYRVLIDILVMLDTKTPYAFTASDRTTLEANLDAATFLGFDKDWIEMVQAKVFGIDRSDVLVAEEKISIMEEELEKCDIALERMQKKRMEAKEKLAIVQNEFEAADTQLFDLLEDRKNLVMKMAEFKKIISAKDRPFGI